MDNKNRGDRDWAVVGFRAALGFSGVFAWHLASHYEYMGS